MGIPVRTEAMSDYPPTGLAESVRALPEWIQLGCGDAEYVCAEKNATFLGGNMPDKLPDLSNHSSFFAEVMRENPGLYDKLKTKNTKLGVTLFLHMHIRKLPVLRHTQSASIAIEPTI